MEHVELFCEKLVVLVKGKSVINGYLSDIKKEYKKKNIVVCGDIDSDVVKKQNGVKDVKKVQDEYIISIEDDSYVNTLFKCISKFDNIKKFSVALC